MAINNAEKRRSMLGFSDFWDGNLLTAVDSSVDRGELLTRLGLMASFAASVGGPTTLAPAGEPWQDLNPGLEIFADYDLGQVFDIGPIDFNQSLTED